MPRSARIHYPGGVFHVTSRFARDEWHLDKTGARAEYLRLLANAAARTDTQILAYCLMSNHTHLVLMQHREPLSRLFKSVHTAFARWVAKRSRSKYALGPVFAGRPRELLVERQHYLDVLVRYIHNNPVRAGVVQSAAESDWSSHRAYIGEAERPDWLQTDVVLGTYGKRAKTQAKRFDDFVRAGSAEGRRPELGGRDDPEARERMREVFGDGHRLSDGVLGGEEFVAKVRGDGAPTVQPVRRARLDALAQRYRPTIDDLIDAALAVHELEPWEFEKRPRARRCVEARRAVIWLWVHEFGGQQIDVARALRVSTAAVAQQYAVCMRRVSESDDIAGMMLAVLDAQLVAKQADKRPDDATPPARFHVDD